MNTIENGRIATRPRLEEEKSREPRKKKRKASNFFVRARSLKEKRKKKKERNSIQFPFRKPSRGSYRARHSGSILLDRSSADLPPRRVLRVRLAGCRGRGIHSRGSRRGGWHSSFDLASLCRGPVRWSLLHHTPNAHVHCPSSQQGS